MLDSPRDKTEGHLVLTNSTHGPRDLNLFSHLKSTPLVFCMQWMVPNGNYTGSTQQIPHLVL